MYDGDILLRYVLFVELVMLPINHGTSHGETNRMHIYINILYVEPHIYNNVEYHMYGRCIYIFVGRNL